MTASLFFLLLVHLGVLCSPIGANYERAQSQDMEKQITSSIEEVILIGGDRLMIIDHEKSTEEHKHINWEVKSSDIVGLPHSFQPYFKSLDDAKPVDNNTKLLISSSGGAVALIERETKNCLFYARTPNAHSVEYLPNNRLAVALSIAKGGNRIEIYDAKRSNVPLFVDSLYSAHGVVWNEERKLLYALSYNQLRAYSLKNWNGRYPKLALEKEWTLPAKDGHDLFAPSSNKLLLSTSSDVWEFNIEKETFRHFEPIEKEKRVKSIYYDEQTQEVVYTKGETRWWSHRVHFLNPQKTISVPEMRLYKARIIKRHIN